jgi:kynurenine 3-monooxygenase
LTVPKVDAANQSTTHFRAGSPETVTVIGAGPAGALISILLARRGHGVTAFERLPDLRGTSGVSGRSINLALADRGISALKQAGVFTAIESLLVPMRGRMLHDISGQQRLIPYGNKPHEVVYSIERAKLTAALLDCAEREHHVDIRFRQTCISVDPTKLSLCMQDIPTGKVYSLPLKYAIGADGAGSVLRRFLVECAGAKCSEEMLTHGYKELTIAAEANGAYRMEPHALHVWPRGEFMLIALPNIGGSFTLTLFLPHDGPQSFASLTSETELTDFFREYFPDALTLLPDLARQFFSHPTGSMGTVRCDRWSLDDALLLLGDAAHAIVPFHGQGMNCAFEDCVELDRLLAANDWRAACEQFQTRRIPNCNAIADMALENYVEMRDTVRDPKFQLRQALSLDLERRHPTRFIPRYSMVMFHHEIPYVAALERGRIQNDILLELTRDAESLATIDFSKAANLIETRLPEIL